jgi:hypothetical protein
MVWCVWHLDAVWEKWDSNLVFLLQTFLFVLYSRFKCKVLDNVYFSFKKENKKEKRTGIKATRTMALCNDRRMLSPVTRWKMFLYLCIEISI